MISLYVYCFSLIFCWFLYIFIDFIYFLLISIDYIDFQLVFMNFLWNSIAVHSISLEFNSVSLSFFGFLLISLISFGFPLIFIDLLWISMDVHCFSFDANCFSFMWFCFHLFFIDLCSMIIAFHVCLFGGILMSTDFLEISIDCDWFLFLSSIVVQWFSVGF